MTRSFISNKFIRRTTLSFNEHFNKMKRYRFSNNMAMTLKQSHNFNAHTRIPFKLFIKIFMANYNASLATMNPGSR